MGKGLKGFKDYRVIYPMLKYVYLGWTIRTIKNFTRCYLNGRER